MAKTVVNNELLDRINNKMYNVAQMSRITAALSFFNSNNLITIRKDPRVKKINLNEKNLDLYSYRLGPNGRIIFFIHKDRIVVQDIITSPRHIRVGYKESNN